MANPYDDLIAAPGAAVPGSAANPYDEVIVDQRAQQQAQMRAAVTLAVGSNPQEIAAQRQLAKYVGFAPAVGEALPDEMKRLAAVKRVVDDTANAPVLRKAYTNEDFARIGRDDSGPLSGIERTFGGTVRDVIVTAGKGFVGFPQAVVGLADIPTFGYAGKALESAGVRFNEAQKILDKSYSPAQRRANDAVQEADGFVETLGTMLQNPSTIATTIGQSIPQMLGGAALGRAILASAPKITPWLAAALGEGVLGAGSAAEQIRADTADGLLTLKQSSAALLSGAGTTLFGAAGGKLAQKLRIADIDTVLVSRGADAVTAKALKDGFVLSIAKAGISEGVFEEMPQSVQEQLWQNWATDKPLGQGVGKAAAMGLLAGATTGAAVQGARRALQRQAEVTGAEDSANNLKAQFDLAAQALLRERNPDEFRTLVQSMADNTEGAPTEIYVDAEVLNQLAPELLNQLPQSVRDALPDALAANDVVAISTGDVLTIAPGTPLEQVLIENARIGDPMAMSQVEAKKAGAQAQEFLAQEAERVIQQASDQQAMQASSDRVKQGVLDQLNTVGRFRKEVNEGYATWTAAFYTTLAGRTGLTPEQMAAKYPLRVVGQSGQGAVLNAMADQTQTPEFQNFFGDSKVVDAEGKPLVVYHGTQADITEFDLARANPNDPDFTVNGFHFHEDSYMPGVFAGKTGNVMPVYLSIKNPASYAQVERTADNISGTWERDYPQAATLLVAVRLDLERQGFDGFKPYKNGGQWVAFRPEQIKSAIGNRGAFDPNDPNILNQAARQKPGPDAPGVGLEDGNKLGFWPALRVKLTGKLKLPEKAPILTGTTNVNAAKQIAAIDGILKKFPKATESTAEWTKMMAYALGSTEVPIPPYAFIRDLNSTGSVDKLRTLTQGQIDDASHGFENAAEFRRAYTAGELGVETTGKLFMWSFLSRGVSPYTQEALFIDAFDGADKWIAMAARGEFTEAVFPEYEAWAKSVAPKGSGQPGAGATHNLNAFGQDFLFKMSRVGKDGKTHMQRLHDMMADPAQTGKQIRREFATFGEGVGIDNKVVSFTLLVAGFNDVMVLDRVQIRQLWDDGKFNGVNLYDGVSENKMVTGKDGVAKMKPVKLAGSSLNNLAEGARGILVYEAIERGLEAKIQQMYAELGRPQDASIGRYHWETWVADSQQEASHGTLGAILADAKGDDQAIASVSAKQGEYGAYEYGALYNRDSDATPWFGYQTPTGGEFAFSVPAFRAFLEDIKRPGTGVVPTKFKVTESGNAPWYTRPEVNQERLEERARYWADRAGGSGEGQRAIEEAVRQQAADRAGPDTTDQPEADRPLEQGPRGTFSPKNLELALNENADLSTFLHETGHFFLEVMADLASQPGAPADIATDMAALLKWFGVADLATWNALPLDGKRPYHERFAESFEQYLMEGKAPSVELQPLFRKFRAWMLNVYKSLKAFVDGRTGETQIQLSPEIRQVFDRMLASEAQIAEANEVAGLLPNEEADAEANERLTARSLRDLKWTVNARAREIKKLQAQAKEQRKEVEAEVTAEVNQMPEFQAKEMLATMRKENKEQLNDTELAIIADSFGYPDVGTMLQAIDAAGKKADVIEGMTDQRMLEQYGDLIDQRAIEAAANEAVHNEARARSLATELRSQAEMLNPRTDTGQVNAQGSRITVNALVEAAKQFAANVISRTPLRDLKSKAWQHTAAERRAGKRWAEATAKGETQEAVKAKQDQMLNNAAAKAAIDAQAEMRKMLEFFRRVIKDNNEKVVEKGRDPDVVNAARAVLAAYGVAPKAGKTALEYLALVEKNDPAMFAALQPSVQGALNLAQPLDALTMDELRGLHEEIQAMWHLAKRSRQMEVDGNLLDIEDAEAELQDRMQEIGVPDTMPGDTGAVTPREELARKLQYAGSILRRVEQWAQGMGGAFTKLVFQPVKEAADRYRADRVVYRKRYQDLVDNVAPALTKGLIAAPELNYTFGEGHNGIGHAELLHAILHTGNGSNKRKLLLGRNWATENADGTLNTDRWDAFLKRMHDTGVLTKAHYDFAQGVWDLLEQTKPLAQKTHRDVFGRYFAEVTADSFDTPFGSYTGGYVPAQADPRIVQDADLRKLAEAENENMSFSFPGTNKGFTKGRVEYNRPLMLDLRTIGQHLDKVLLFSHMEPAVRDVNKLLSRKGVSYSLGRIDPTIYAGMLTPWLSRSARQVVETPIVGDGGISRVMSAARARAGMALMFANLSNTLQQLTGFSVAAIKVKPASMMRATATFIAAPKQTAKAVADASVFMANRMENEIAAINDAMDAILLDPNLYEKSQAWTQKHAYFLQTAMANTMEPIIWTAAYNDAITRGDSDRDAVRHADSVIRTTQGSTLPEDVSRLETGPAWARLFTQFIGYFNMLANTNGTALLQVSREMGLKKGAGKALGIITLGMLAPIWVAEAIAHAMRGGPEDEDKDGYLDDWLMAVFGMGTIKGTFAMVPFLGQAAQLTVNRFNDNPADDKFSLSPAVSLIESTVSAPFSVYKAIAEDGNRQKAVRDVASAVSIVTGLPAFAIARPLGYLAGVEQGKVEPTDALDLARGLVSGTASPASK